MIKTANLLKYNCHVCLTNKRLLLGLTLSPIYMCTFAYVGSANTACKHKYMRKNTPGENLHK